jgi:hypothetical protein
MLIGFVGEKGAGKSTLMNVLSSNFIELTFANPVKIVAATISAGTAELHDAVQKELFNEKIGMTNRELMQRVGDLLREQLPVYLSEMFSGSPIVEIAKASLLNVKSRGLHIIFSDVRYHDEAKMIKDEGGLLVRIVRPRQTHVPDFHSSETQSKEVIVDYELVNDGTEQEMLEKFMLFLSNKS